MLEDGEGKESSRQHFRLPAIMERDSNKKQQQRVRHQGRKGMRDRVTGEEREGHCSPQPQGWIPD